MDDASLLFTLLLRVKIIPGFRYAGVASRLPGLLCSMVVLQSCSGFLMDFVLFQISFAPLLASSNMSRRSFFLSEMGACSGRGTGHNQGQGKSAVFSVFSDKDWLAPLNRFLLAISIEGVQVICPILFFVAAIQNRYNHILPLFFLL